MAVKVYKNSAWQDINGLKKYVNGAWQDADNAYKYNNGAWEEVWSNVLTFNKLQSNSFGTKSKGEIVSKTEFLIYATKNAYSGTCGYGTFEATSDALGTVTNPTIEFEANGECLQDGMEPNKVGEVSIVGIDASGNKTVVNCNLTLNDKTVTEAYSNVLSGTFKEVGFRVKFSIWYFGYATTLNLLNIKINGKPFNFANSVCWNKF